MQNTTQQKDIKILQNGNYKLKNMLVYSHSPVKGCLDCSSCKDTCYAIKSYRQYPNVKTAWDRNLNMAKNDLESFKINITKQLIKTKKNVVRIHSSGDFISQDYVNAWTEIIAAFPEINFYTYTKSLDRFNFSKILQLSNINIIDSFIGSHLNYGDQDHVNMLISEYDSFLCPATIDKNIKCGESCNYCVYDSNVCFLQH